MPVLAFYSVIISIICVIVGTYVISIDQKSRLNKVFFAFSLVTAGVAFFEFMARSSETPQRSALWYRYMHSLLPFVSLTSLHFAHIFSGNLKKISWKSAFLMYAPGLIFFVFITVKNVLAVHVVKDAGIFIIGGYEKEKWNFILIAFMSIAGFINILMVADTYTKTEDEVKSKQATLLIFAFSMPMVAAIISVVVSGVFGIKIPDITSVATLVMMLMISYVIKKYRVFSVSFESAVGDIIDLMQGYVIITDNKGDIMSINPALAADTGYDADDLKGQNIQMIFRSKDNQDPRKAIFETMGRRGSMRNYEALLVAKNRNNINIVYSANRVKNAADEDVGVIITANSIEERVNLETELTKMVEEQAVLNSKLTESYEKLKDLDRLKQNFISITSHELRTPLTSIKGFLRFISGGVAGPLNEKQREFINTIESNTERLLKLINELLDMSKMESGTFSIERHPVNLNSVADISVKEMSSILANKNMTINKAYREPDITVSIDSGRIQQVIINLMNNSSKFSPSGSKLELITERIFISSYRKIPEYFDRKLLVNEQYAAVTVKDQGVGMDPAYTKRIFDRFYQIEDANVRKHDGVGLGLNIAKNIVEAHGGIIWASSEGKGRGSSFTFLLPIE